MHLSDNRTTIVTSSPEETLKLGEKIGSLLIPGDVIALDGDLGAGKTLLTRGICEGMGLDPQYVTSPTFTIVNEYDEPLEAGSEIMKLYHFDTYRLGSSEDFLAAGLDEYFYMDGVCVIEWANIIDSILPHGTVRINITGTGDERTFEITDPFGRLSRA